jgi:hypothetical protein
VTISISILVFFVIHSLGYWDVEDIFTSGSSIGSQFGALHQKGNETSLLVHSLHGVPVLDFGIIGGYRLPFQGTINFGPLWILRSLFPAELILALTHLLAILISALAFGRFWEKAQERSGVKPVVSSAVCALCWVSLFFPTFEHVLQQDWFTASIAHQGFITVMTSLVTIALVCTSGDIDQVSLRASVRLLLFGCYTLLIGHTGLFALYFATILFAASGIVLIAIRRRSVAAQKLTVSHWRLEGVLLAGLVLRTVALLGELLAEVSGRASIGSSTWWADPTRDLRGFIHFVGQLGGTELKPWLAITVPDLLDKVNISKLSRVPHTAALVTLCVLMMSLRKRASNNATIALLMTALWIGNFLFMIGILKNPIRVPGDYHYRDILITLSMIGVGLSLHLVKESIPRYRRWLWNWSLPVSLMLTSVAVSVSNPMFHFEAFRSSSPYALVNTLRDSDPWIDAFEQATGTTHGVVAVVDPFFSNRWTGEAWKDWRGLRGFYEFREAGFTTLEGSPKIRDASAFTGLTDSLKQVLDPPTSDFCGSGLLSFLRVTTIIMSTESRDQCYLRATNKSGNITLRASEPAPLADSGMLISNLSQQQLFRTDSNSTDNGGIRCGLLADPACFEKLGLLPSNQWQATARNCSLPCVFQMTRTTNTTNEQGMIVLPFNIGNALRVTDQTGTTIPSTSYNGMIAIPANTPGNTITITVGTDWRMWLQVITAYLQYAVLIPPLITATQRATKRKRKE